MLRVINQARGKWEAYIRRQATCGIYSGRGHTGQGASPARLSHYAVKIGTLLEQQYLDGRYDFRNYDDYVRWGMSRGRVGMPRELLEHTVIAGARKTFLVESWEACRDLMFNDHTLHCGSSIGLSNKGNPFSPIRGSWAHDMQWPCGYDDTKEYVGQTAVFGDNSWGSWNHISNIPDAWKPWGQGMFATTVSTMQRGLRSRGTFAFINMEGFDAGPLDNSLI